MSSLSSRGGGGTGWGHWSTMHPLPYRRSHQYYPRPPHLPAMHVVLSSSAELLIQSLSWEVILKALGVSLKTTCRSMRVDLNQSQRSSLETCTQSWSHDIRWEASKSFRGFPRPDLCVKEGGKKREQNKSSVYSMYCNKKKKKILQSFVAFSIKIGLLGSFCLLHYEIKFQILQEQHWNYVLILILEHDQCIVEEIPSLKRKIFCWHNSLIKDHSFAQYTSMSFSQFNFPLKIFFSSCRGFALWSLVTSSESTNNSTFFNQLYTFLDFHCEAWFF